MFCFWIFGETLGAAVDGIVVDGAVAVEGAGVPLAPGAAGPGLAEVAGDGVVVAGAAAVEGGVPFVPGAGWSCLVEGAGDVPGVAVPGVAVGAGNGWPGAPGSGWPIGAFGGVVWPGWICGCGPVIGGFAPGGVWL